MKKCPYCAEQIQDEAIKCRYCGSSLVDAAPPPPRPAVSPPPSAPPLPTASIVATDEKTYYSDGAITVTSTRAVFPDKTYAMSNVTSVSVTKDPSVAQGCGCMLLIVGALSIFGGVAGVLIAIVLFIVGVKLMKVKDQYIVRLGSASGEANALTHPDKAYVDKIVAAVSQAIVERG